MATSAQRKITVTYTGDVAGVEEVSAATNQASPAQLQLITLASGDNVITAPTGGSTPTACTIRKPAANAIALKIKGNAGDTGVRLHNTDPDTISIDPSTASFIINAGAQVVGVRLMWT
jgi:hypothetical protein